MLLIWFSTFLSYAYVLLGDKPTRASASSITCLRNVFTDDLSSLEGSVTSVINTSISDHSLILHCSEKTTSLVTVKIRTGLMATVSASRLE